MPDLAANKYKQMKYLIIMVLLNCSQPIQVSNNLAEAGVSIIDPKIIYDPSYVKIPYPMGDVSPDRGVCTDVIIRSYRKVGVDLQKRVYEFRRQQHLTTDKNIDHRRVPNLMQYFRAKSLEVNRDYIPGDVVCWRLRGSILHIGLVVNKKSLDGKRWMLIHNIGGGQVIEDILYSYVIIGHYKQIL